MPTQSFRSMLVALGMSAMLYPLPVAGQSETQDDAPYHQQLRQWLDRNNYKHWSDVPQANGDFRASSSPHGDLVKVYVNRIAASQPDELPVGSVLVLENYGRNRQLVSLNVMQRAKGFAPKYGDWYFATYLPGGKVAKARGKSGEIPFAGRVVSCIECHRQAWDDDFVFFND